MKTKIAIPNSKRLLPPLLEYLNKIGWKISTQNRVLFPSVPEGSSARLIKPRAVPDLFAIGCLDAGFTGLDVMVESGLPLDQYIKFDLGLNPVHLMVATPESKKGILESPPNRPLIVGTEYPTIAENWMINRGLSHVCIQTGGSTEAYIPDPCDVIIDVVETGETLRANGLVVVEEVLFSTTHLWVRKMTREIKSLISLIEENK